tara:strand:+ start:18232 stop:18873 length:642 start_codon:yes stop_codon:yes gene_type:complete
MKTEQELKRQLLIENEGFVFDQVVPVSAKEAFGEDWYAKVSKYIDPIVIAKINSEKEKTKKLKSLDSLKPANMDLAGLIPQRKDHPFKAGWYITVNSGLYMGEYKVLNADEASIIISSPYMGEASGKFFNTIGIKKLNKKLDAISIESQESEKQNRFVNNNIKSNVIPIDRDTKKSFGWLKVAAIAGLLVGSSIAIYYYAGNGKSNTSTQNQI